MRAPAGAVVRIFYDGPGLAAGDALVTATGRVYVVLARREQLRGAHQGRQHLRCLVASEVPEGAKSFTLRWYPRKRRRHAVDREDAG